ncbi:MAG: dihydropteroate synthase [Alphaproteobacteria bacterium]|nr:dihydropteroate synthase [Alphaproteobacteria bacterium]
MAARPQAAASSWSRSQERSRLAGAERPIVSQAALARGLRASSAGSPPVYLRPIVRHGAGTVTLADGPLAFSEVEILIRRPDHVSATATSIEAVKHWAKDEGAPITGRIDDLTERLAHPRPAWAGLSWGRPRIMGVVNVTPDSFSDGGRFMGADAAIAHGRALVAAGADIIDIGGESTRPGAAPIEPAEECRRVVPVIAGLRGCGAVISVDTRHVAVMAAALDAGATVINDISALTHDPGALALAARRRAAVVLMHIRGEPSTMQQDPVYDCAPLDVFDYLEERLGVAVAAGIAPESIAVDPGFGFGKSVAHNMQIMARLALLHGLGVPIVLGVSRKSSIAKLSRGESADRRLPGSLAAGLFGISQGVQILRVHDVAETAQALAIWRAIQAQA